MDYAKDVLVTTNWLADHLSDEGIVVAQVDENPDLYDDATCPAPSSSIGIRICRTHSNVT